MTSNAHLEQFNKLLTELSKRSYASTDIAWQCDIFLPDDVPEPMFFAHPRDMRAAFRGSIPTMRIEHRLHWEDFADVRLLDELARCVAEPGHTFDDPPIKQESPSILRSELQSHVGEKLFDWTWIAGLLDFLAELPKEVTGIVRTNRAWPLITGLAADGEEIAIDESVLDHRTRIEARRLLNVVSQIDFQGNKGNHAKPRVCDQNSEYVIAPKAAVAATLSISTKTLRKRMLDGTYDAREVNNTTVEINRRHFPG